MILYCLFCLRLDDDNFVLLFYTPIIPMPQISLEVAVVAVAHHQEDDVLKISRTFLFPCFRVKVLEECCKMTSIVKIIAGWI